VEYGYVYHSPTSFAPTNTMQANQTFG